MIRLHFTVDRRRRTTRPALRFLVDNPSLTFSAAGSFIVENLYNILGVAPNASDEDIKKVYRSLAMRYHPDRNDAPGAEVRFKSITKAYEILSDRARRDEYNQSVNHRIILDAEAEAFELWRSLFQLNGVALPA